MSNTFIDIDAILSENEQWMKLDEEWGNPIDLDTEDDHSSKLTPVFSTLDLMKSTFNSSFLFKKVRRKLGRQLSQKSITSALEYEDFINDLHLDESRESPKDNYFINGEIVSALSVEKICDKIDDIFKSIDKLASTSSTLRIKGKVLPDVADCSISDNGLSFDETISTSNGSCFDELSMCLDNTITSSNKRFAFDDIDQCIEEALDRFNSTLASLDGVDESTIESVTTLVKKFSSILNSPLVRTPRRQPPCPMKVKDLADFWNKRTCVTSK